jgi:resuscitation-promoting factor RpfB
MKAAVTACAASLVIAASACADNTADTADSAAPQVTETTRVVAAKKRVPHVEGLSLGQATKRLLTRGFVVGDVSKRPSAKPRRTVLDQSRRPGSKAKPGARVALVVAKPFPRVPDTVGEGRRAAGRELRLAGFDVLKTKQRTDSASPGTVIEQSPTGGTRARPGATVTITIAKKPPPPPPPTVQEDNCTSGYSPCLPPASDYDCAGGSGDGPAYADGPIAVTGSDPYGLDDDSDGVGCE